jgi:dTDP-D-glucose 4,6-dehydratase
MCLIGTGVETSTREIFDSLAAHCGYERPPVMGPRRPGDIERIALDASLAREVWGWAPRVSLDEGMGYTVAAFREDYEAAHLRQPAVRSACPWGYAVIRRVGWSLVCRAVAPSARLSSRSCS